MKLLLSFTEQNMDLQFPDFICDVWFQNLPGIQFPCKISLNSKETLKCKYRFIHNIKDSCMKPDIYVTPGFVTVLGLVFLCTLNVFFFFLPYWCSLYPLEYLYQSYIQKWMWQQWTSPRYMLLWHNTKYATFQLILIILKELDMVQQCFYVHSLFHLSCNCLTNQQIYVKLHPI